MSNTVMESRAGIATGARVRSAFLSQMGPFDVALTHYPPGHIQAEHEHGRSQLSFLLAGSLVETVDARDYAAGPSQLCVKERGTAHSNRYGEKGALMLSFHFGCPRTEAAALDGRRWSWRSLAPHELRSAIELASGGAAPDPDRLWDQLAAGEAPEPARAPPEWLRWAHWRLGSAPALCRIAELAAQAGVHRVQLSREFVRHYGLTPSDYRQKQMIAHALVAMLQRRMPGAEAAYEAGFADQSHMMRAVRKAAGLSPGRLAALLQ